VGAEDFNKNLSPDVRQEEGDASLRRGGGAEELNKNLLPDARQEEGVVSLRRGSGGRGTLAR